MYLIYIFNYKKIALIQNFFDFSIINLVKNLRGFCMPVLNFSEQGD